MNEDEKHIDEKHLYDLYAGLAMQALVPHIESFGKNDLEKLAIRAFAVADQMLITRQGGH